MFLLTAKIKRKPVSIRSQRLGTSSLLGIMYLAKPQLSPNTIFTAFSGVYGNAMPVFSTNHACSGGINEKD